VPTTPKSKSPGKLTDDLTLALSRAVFGGMKSFSSIALIATLLVAMSLFGNTITTDLQQPWAKVIFYSLFPLMMALFYFKIRRAVSHVSLVILQDENPLPAKALILFLSPPGLDAPLIASLIHDPDLRGRIQDIEVRNRLKASWRMPLEAIAHHRPRLEALVLIPSKDSGTSLDGTWRCMEDFQSLVRTLCDPQKPKISSLAELTANQRWKNGVDFENAQELVDSIGETYQALNQADLEDHEIMVDVTGGQKPSSIAGAAVSLERGGRRFQYVSPKGYKLRAYDITYRTQ
jgi:hypothetical protein